MSFHLKSFLLCVPVLLNVSQAQIRTVPCLPENGFAERIRSAVDSVWIVDTHEHLETEEARISRAADLDFTCFVITPWKT